MTTLRVQDGAYIESVSGGAVDMKCNLLGEEGQEQRCWRWSAFLNGDAPLEPEAFSTSPNVMVTVSANLRGDNLPRKRARHFCAYVGDHSPNEDRASRRFSTSKATRLRGTCGITKWKASILIRTKKRAEIPYHLSVSIRVACAVFSPLHFMRPSIHHNGTLAF